MKNDTIDAPPEEGEASDDAPADEEGGEDADSIDEF